MEINQATQPKQAPADSPQAGSSPNSTVPNAPPTQAWTGPRVQTRDSRQKSPALAAILSLVPGLGQVYVGYYQDGFINIVIVGSIIGLLDIGLGGMEPLAGFFLGFFWLYNMIDASRRASIFNQALAGLGPMDLPDGMVSMGSQGSLLGGILLILFGGFGLAHTVFDVPLDWVSEWWPVAVIALGGYLIYKAVIADRKTQEK